MAKKATIQQKAKETSSKPSKDKASKEQSGQLSESEKVIEALRQKAFKSGGSITYKEVEQTLIEHKSLDSDALDSVMEKLSNEDDILVIDGGRESAMEDLPEEDFHAPDHTSLKAESILSDSDEENLAVEVPAVKEPLSNEDDEEDFDEDSAGSDTKDADSSEDQDETSSGTTTKKVVDTSLGRSNDPVRIYLRKMGSVALLSREGEVVIAKKIETAENLILESLLDLEMGLGVS